MLVKGWNYETKLKHQTSSDKGSDPWEMGNKMRSLWLLLKAHYFRKCAFMWWGTRCKTEQTPELKRQIWEFTETKVAKHSIERTGHHRESFKYLRKILMVHDMQEKTTHPDQKPCDSQVIEYTDTLPNREIITRQLLLKFYLTLLKAIHKRIRFLPSNLNMSQNKILKKI